MNTAAGGSGDFRTAMAPTVDVLRNLTEALVGASNRHGNMQGPGSVAIADLNVEMNGLGGRLRVDQPLTCGQSLSGMTLTAAADYGRSYAEMFAGNRVPVYGHLVVARAALEASVVSSWMCATNVTSEVRAKRAVCALLYSASEVQRLAIPQVKNGGGTVQQWTSLASTLGWSVVRRGRKPFIDDTGYPDMASALSQLLVGDGDADLGKVQWSLLSAVAHGTWYGLRQGIIGDPAPASSLRPSVVNVGTQASSVNIQSICVIRALRVAGAERMRYMGWEDDVWRDAWREAEQHERKLLATYPRSIERGP